MDTMLIAITSLSLAAAAGMGAMLARTLRIERRRSDARVALLVELAGNRLAGSRPAGRVAERPQRASAALDDFDLRPSIDGPNGASSLFENRDQPSAWPRRFAVVGALAIVLSGVFVGVRGLRPADEGSTGSEAPATAVGDANAPGGSGRLELLSLQHAEEDGSLVISGMVQNPRGSAPLSGVQATVVLLGTDGRTLAGSRAPLDFTTLAPGAESAFVIRVPAPGTVSRYRVGFRGQDDRVLGHIDRRNNDTVARKQAP